MAAVDLVGVKGDRKRGAGWFEDRIQLGKEQGREKRNSHSVLVA